MNFYKHINTFDTKAGPSSYHYFGFLNGKGPKWVITRAGNRELLSAENWEGAQIDVKSYPRENDTRLIPTDPQEFKLFLASNYGSTESRSFTCTAGFLFACIRRSTCRINPNLDMNKFADCPDKFVEYNDTQYRLADLPVGIDYYQVLINNPIYSY